MVQSIINISHCKPDEERVHLSLTKSESPRRSPWGESSTRRSDPCLLMKTAEKQQAASKADDIVLQPWQPTTQHCASDIAHAGTGSCSPVTIRQGSFSGRGRGQSFPGALVGLVPYGCSTQLMYFRAALTSLPQATKGACAAWLLSVSTHKLS